MSELRPADDAVPAGPDELIALPLPAVPPRSLSGPAWDQDGPPAPAAKKPRVSRASWCCLLVGYAAAFVAASFAFSLAARVSEPNPLVGNWEIFFVICFAAPSYGILFALFLYPVLFTLGLTVRAAAGLFRKDRGLSARDLCLLKQYWAPRPPRRNPAGTHGAVSSAVTTAVLPPDGAVALPGGHAPESAPGAKSLLGGEAEPGAGKGLSAQPSRLAWGRWAVLGMWAGLLSAWVVGPAEGNTRGSGFLLLALGGGPTAGVLALSFAGLIGARAFGRAEGFRLPARKIDAGMVGAAATIGVSFVGGRFCPGGTTGLGMAWAMIWVACEAIFGAFLAGEESRTRV